MLQITTEQGRPRALRTGTVSEQNRTAPSRWSLTTLTLCSVAWGRDCLFRLSTRLEMVWPSTGEPIHMPYVGMSLQYALQHLQLHISTSLHLWAPTILSRNACDEGAARQWPVLHRSSDCRKTYLTYLSLTGTKTIIILSRVQAAPT